MIGTIKKQFKNKSVSLTELNQSMKNLSNLLSGRDQTGKISNESLAFQHNLDHSQQTIERREMARQKECSFSCKSIYENITNSKPDYNYLISQERFLVTILNKYSDLAKIQKDNSNYFIKAFPGLIFSADYNEIGRVTNIQVTTIERDPDKKYPALNYIIFPINKAKPSYPEAVQQVIKVAKKYIKSNSQEA